MMSNFVEFNQDEYEKSIEEVSPVESNNADNRENYRHSHWIYYQVGEKELKNKYGIVGIPELDKITEKRWIEKFEGLPDVCDDVLHLNVVPIHPYEGKLKKYGGVIRTTAGRKRRLPPKGGIKRLFRFPDGSERVISGEEYNEIQRKRHSYVRRYVGETSIYF